MVRGHARAAQGPRGGPLGDRRAGAGRPAARAAAQRARPRRRGWLSLLPRQRADDPARAAGAARAGEPAQPSGLDPAGGAESVSRAAHRGAHDPLGDRPLRLDGGGGRPRGDHRDRRARPRPPAAYRRGGPGAAARRAGADAGPLARRAAAERPLLQEQRLGRGLHALPSALPAPRSAGGAARAGEELSGARGHFDEKERCIFCDVVAQEARERSRVVLETDGFIAFVPWAARSPFEVWVLPREHRSNFEQSSPAELAGLAQAIRLALRKLDLALERPAYNFYLHTLPLREPAAEWYHWHVEVKPVLTLQGGFEWGSGFFINPTPPEEAAAFLRQTEA